jgi:hypothetical protein
MSPRLPPRSRISCCSPQVSCVSGAPDQINHDEIPIPRLHVTFPPQPSAHTAAPSPADSDDKAPIVHFSPRTALVTCYGDAEVPLPRPGVSCLSSSPSPPIVRPQPALQAGGRGRCPLRNKFPFASSSSSDHLCSGNTITRLHQSGVANGLKFFIFISSNFVLDSLRAPSFPPSCCILMSTFLHPACLP